MQGEDAAVFALLEMAQLLAQQQAAVAGTSNQTPATPSGMQPPFAKPTTSSREKKTGRKAGPSGMRHPTPEKIDVHEEHRANQCPDCRSPLNCWSETRTRYTEGIPVIQSMDTQLVIHRD